MQLMINTALVELERYKFLPWYSVVKVQLNYCSEVLSSQKEPSQLEQLSMGLIAVREIPEDDPLHSRLSSIEFNMQKQFLPYAAKVRLGIHKL